ncbi:MAG: hypothetical protein GY903_25585 [Fuerstiella sp.]|nr:hypothetical protein [Fuerstiella sp.]MCP4857870.1 hypothetical protein [Fuerstiella sp.]
MNRVLFVIALLPGIATIASAQDTPQQQWHKAQADYNYTAIARAYADYMIEHGRDVYGTVHSPLFVTAMDRQTGKLITPPFPHVKRKPFMPGWERDRECRGSDRNYGHADPLDQLTLLKILHRLTETTGDKRYADEANMTAAWWMANAQSPIGLYPWGTHTRWDVTRDGGSGQFEFNHVWPYWKLNPEALQKYAMGLWDHYVADKKTGNFNRHAHSHRHDPGDGMEFPWPGSAMIATWTEAYLANPDPEYVRAIDTILNRWESLRDANGHLASCSSYGEWAWYLGYVQAANRLDDWADRIGAKQPVLAEEMRDYGRRNDAAYLKVSDGLLDIKRVGPVKSYLRATGGFNPERLDIIGGPWQDRKDYALFAVMLHERMKRNDSAALQERYRRAVLDTAEVYMSINPEVQWAVWGENMSGAIRLMLAAHELTGNSAYLHRADQFGRLAVDLFLDDASPLPKITSHDNFYEIESVTTPSTDVWMLAVLDLRDRLANVDEAERQTVRIATTGGIWDCTKLGTSAASVALTYGEGGGRTLFLSRRETGFTSTNGLSIDGLELIASDHVNKRPTLEEARPLNGVYRRRFSGKHREPSTATYGGFKDVLDRANLLLVNHGRNAANVTVTVTYHDSWDDRETRDQTVTIKPGKQMLVAVASPRKRFIRRLDFITDTPGAVKLSQFAFAMTPRSKLNPLTPEAAPADLSAFDRVKATQVKDGLVLDLVGDALRKIKESAGASRQPKLVVENELPVLRFDGKDDFLSIPDNDTLDLHAWTVISLVRPTGGPGVVISKIDGKNFMMNYRLQIDKDGKVGAVVRGTNARQQVNRQARANVLNRFAVVAARFDPKTKGVDKVTISVDGVPASYSYQNAEGPLSAITHSAPLLIGCQPGREPRHFKGDIGGILLYNRALSDEELNSTAKWLVEQRPAGKTAGTNKATKTSTAVPTREAIVFLITGQSNAGGVAAFSPETNEKSGMAKKHPTIPGSTAKEVGVPTIMDA